jgi:hypothetical protein
MRLPKTMAPMIAAVKLDARTAPAAMSSAFQVRCRVSGSRPRCSVSTALLTNYVVKTKPIAGISKAHCMKVHCSATAAAITTAAAKK